MAHSTGLKRGELLALDLHRSIDLSNNRLHISNVLSYEKGNHYILKKPLAGEERFIHFTQKDKNVLLEQIHFRKQFMQEHAPDFSDFVPLFSSSYSGAGKPLNSTAITKKWRWFMEEIVITKHPEVRYLSFNSLQQTFGSFLARR